MPERMMEAGHAIRAQGNTPTCPGGGTEGVIMTPASACLGKGNKVAMTARANTVERRIRPPQAPNRSKLTVARGTAYDISATVHDYLRTGSTSNGPAPGAAAAIALVRSQAHGLVHVILRCFKVAGADPQVRAGQSTPGRQRVSRFQLHP